MGEFLYYLFLVIHWGMIYLPSGYLTWWQMAHRDDLPIKNGDFPWLC